MLEGISSQLSQLQEKIGDAIERCEDWGGVAPKGVVTDLHLLRRSRLDMDVFMRLLQELLTQANRGGNKQASLLADLMLTRDEVAHRLETSIPSMTFEMSVMQEALGFMRSEGAEPEDEDDADSEVLDIDDPKFRRPDPHGDYLRAHSDAGSVEAGDGDRWLRSVAESADVDVISQAASTPAKSSATGSRVSTPGDAPGLATPHLVVRDPAGTNGVSSARVRTPTAGKPASRTSPLISGESAASGPKPKTRSFTPPQHPYDADVARGAAAGQPGGARPAAIPEWTNQGAPFREGGSTREGGDSRPKPIAELATEIYAAVDKDAYEHGRYRQGLGALDAPPPKPEPTFQDLKQRLDFDENSTASFDSLQDSALSATRAKNLAQGKRRGVSWLLGMAVKATVATAICHSGPVLVKAKDFVEDNIDRLAAPKPKPKPKPVSIPKPDPNHRARPTCKSPCAPTGSHCSNPRSPVSSSTTTSRTELTVSIPVLDSNDALPSHNYDGGSHCSRDQGPAGPPTKLPLCRARERSVHCERPEMPRVLPPRTMGGGMHQPPPRPVEDLQAPHQVSEGDSPSGPTQRAWVLQGRG